MWATCSLPTPPSRLNERHWHCEQREMIHAHLNQIMSATFMGISAMRVE